MCTVIKRCVFKFKPVLKVYSILYKYVDITVLLDLQVESLFRNFHTRRTLRISVPGKGNKSERKPQMENDRGQDGGTEEPALTNNCNSDAEE